MVAALALCQRLQTASRLVRHKNQKKYLGNNSMILLIRCFIYGDRPDSLDFPFCNRAGGRCLYCIYHHAYYLPYHDYGVTRIRFIPNQVNSAISRKCMPEKVISIK